MNLKDIIYKRKSTRNYLPKEVEQSTLNKINDYITNLKPLNPDIRIISKIVNADEVTYVSQLKSPHYITIFSEEKDNYLENLGFMYQQLDLFLQSLGLGSCWLGMGQYNNDKKIDNLKFIIMISFGYPKDQLYRDTTDFKRKDLKKIMDKEDERLEAARIAPSAVNSQPWYFIHDNQTIHIYRIIPGLIKQKLIGKMNRIDIGIALAHIYISYKDQFKFFKIDNPKSISGLEYEGSFTIEQENTIEQ